MTFCKSVNPVKHLLFIYFLLITQFGSAQSGSSDSLTKPLGKHLKKEGFNPIFSAGTGIVSMISYATYGVSGRAYIPIPLGFRIVADYSNFLFELDDYEMESYISASLQYPLITYGKVLFYASIGANIIVDQTTKDYTSTVGTNTYTFHKGTDYYLNPMFGLGGEYKINKTLSIYNEWNMVNEDALNAFLGIKINLIALGIK